ncbi:MAG: 4Fe-4S binding protein [Nitrospirae bacterium]|nr:4Fe-4S binding protein [Nitrospirota bacterium]
MPSKGTQVVWPRFTERYDKNERKLYFKDGSSEDGAFEYVVDNNLCIGCGFCAGICPCGVWEMLENI